MVYKNYIYSGFRIQASTYEVTREYLVYQNNYCMVFDMSFRHCCYPATITVCNWTIEHVAQRLSNVDWGGGMGTSKGTMILGRLIHYHTTLA